MYIHDVEHYLTVRLLLDSFSSTNAYLWHKVLSMITETLVPLLVHGQKFILKKCYRHPPGARRQL